MEPNVMVMTSYSDNANSHMNTIVDSSGAFSNSYIFLFMIATRRYAQIKVIFIMPSTLILSLACCA